MEWIQKAGIGSIKERQVALADGSTFPYLYFPLLEETGLVRHCFTTRLGGVSVGDCATLNLSFSRGDDIAAVRENYRRLAEALGVSEGQFVLSDQAHTTHVRRVGREDAGNGLVRENRFSQVDGMVTDEPGIVLSTFYADCVPLYFLDPAHRAIGLSHSGWRGTVARMGAVTAGTMAREFGTRPEDLLCAIGPSICRDCYEVSEDVAEAFARAFPGHGDELISHKGNGKFQLDLWRANERVLLDAGVKKEHIALAGICTCCNSGLLFSHRASKGRRGNLGAFLMLEGQSGMGKSS